MTKRPRVPWVATLVVAVISFLGIMGLEVMIELGSWLRTPAFVLLVTALAVVVARLLGSQRVLPTLVGAVMAIVTMVPVFAIAEDGSRRVLPTPGALGDLGGAIRAGVEHAATTVAPAPPAPGFTAL